MAIPWAILVVFGTMSIFSLLLIVFPEHWASIQNRGHRTEEPTDKQIETARTSGLGGLIMSLLALAIFSS